MISSLIAFISSCWFLSLYALNPKRPSSTTKTSKGYENKQILLRNWDLIGYVQYFAIKNVALMNIQLKNIICISVHRAINIVRKMIFFHAPRSFKYIASVSQSKAFKAVSIVNLRFLDNHVSNTCCLNTQWPIMNGYLFGIQC